MLTRKSMRKISLDKYENNSYFFNKGIPMTNELIIAIDRLQSFLGNHGNAAKFLGISRDHYCAIRNGRVNIPKRTASYIILKASQVSGEMNKNTEQQCENV